MSVHIEYENEDIYRGDPPKDLKAEPAPSLSSVSISSVSSSSSSSFLGGGRIGAIAAKLELAISRWARNVRGNSSNASDSSDTSSSTSSTRSSVVTLTKSQLARRRRKHIRTASSLRTSISERDIAARITRMKALEMSRQIPREFALYLPPSKLPAVQEYPDTQTGAETSDKNDRRVTWTTSLPVVLAQLDLAIRKPPRHRRPRPRHRKPSAMEPDLETSPYCVPQIPRMRHVGSSRPHSASPARKEKKGKQRATREQSVRTIPTTTNLEDTQSNPQAWFLDVANPTWADLRAIGKLLHIHPLTLEDILQQDPREKLELFSKLGYYFVSFRAIESQTTRDKIRRETGLMDPPTRSALDEGSLGEANVYLTIFKDGICCFHFTDVSEHTNRVRNRLVLQEQLASVNKSSDWIMHNVLDSIVDSFFPFLEEIEKESVAIDNLVYNLEPDPAVSPGLSEEFPRSNTRDFLPQSTKTRSSLLQPQRTFSTNEKYSPAEKIRNSYRPRFASPRLNIRLFWRRAKRRVSNSWSSFWAKPDLGPSSTQLTLRRMARVRKLVTVLGRLLATKSDVVTQIQKRLAKTSEKDRQHNAEEFEVAIYMGDVQDHILTLQHSLAHYERMLSQSHPTYLAQLRNMSETSKQSADQKLFYLTVVAISVLCIQTLTGLCSLNVQLPTNGHDPGQPYYVFGGVVSLAVIILATFLLTVRYWRNDAKKRTRRSL